MLPGTKTTEVLEHEFWEEVFVMNGDYMILDPKTLQPVETFPTGGAYACRPPHKKHGPFGTVNGAMLIEIRYFRDDQAIGA